MLFRFFSWYWFSYLFRIGFDNVPPLPFVLLILIFPLSGNSSLLFTTVLCLFQGVSGSFRVPQVIVKVLGSGNLLFFHNSKRS